MITQGLSQMAAWWDEFWFSPRSMLNLGVFRILLCGTLFFMALSRQFDLASFYSDQGMVPAKVALQIIPEFNRPHFAWFFWGESGMVAAHSIYVMSLLLLTFGMGGRGLALVAWVCHQGFLQRNFSVAFGADLIGGIFLLLMIGTQSCERLSLWRWIRSRRGQSPVRVVQADLFTQVFYRMIQVQLCVIYLYTGMEKLRGRTWWEGTALWSVFANPQMVIADLSFMRHFPVVVALATFMTPLFEMGFTPLVWNRRIRPLVLTAGLLFHLGIGILMALMNFTLIMLSPYVLFLPETKVVAFLRRIRVPI